MCGDLKGKQGRHALCPRGAVSNRERKEETSNCEEDRDLCLLPSLLYLSRR